MKTTTKIPFAVLSMALIGWTTGASASLLFTSGSQTSTIDFQSDVGWDSSGDTTPEDNVYKYKSGSGNWRYLVENESDGWKTSWSNDFGMSADAWSWQKSGANLGMGAGNPTQFGDYNDNSSLADHMEPGVIPGVNVGNHSTFGISGDTSDEAYSLGHNNGNFQPWADFSLTLRVKNTSGNTINNWNFGLDTWFADNDANASVISILYSTDNSTFTPIDSYTTTNNAGVYQESGLGGAFTASVADDGFLYLQIANSRPGASGSGAGVVIDNLTVTAAIPEPSTFALMAGFLILGFTTLRRRRA